VLLLVFYDHLLHVVAMLQECSEFTK